MSLRRLKSQQQMREKLNLYIQFILELFTAYALLKLSTLRNLCLHLCVMFEMFNNQLFDSSFFKCWGMRWTTHFRTCCLGKTISFTHCFCPYNTERKWFSGVRWGWDPFWVQDFFLRIYILNLYFSLKLLFDNIHCLKCNINTIELNWLKHLFLNYQLLMIITFLKGFN